MLYHVEKLPNSHQAVTQVQNQSVNNTIREHFCHTTASNTSPQNIIQLSLLEQLALFETE